MSSEENKINLSRMYRAMMQCKWVYVASIVLFLGLGIFMSIRSLSKVEIRGSLLIGDSTGEERQSSGNLLSMMKTFSIGGFSGSSVDNEVLILESHDVMLRTVRTLGLNRSYVAKTDGGKKVMLYRNIPIRVEAPAELFDTLAASFIIKIHRLDNGNVNIKAFKGLLKHTLAEKKDVSLPVVLETPYGNFSILNTGIESTYHDFNITINGNEGAAHALSKAIDIVTADKLSDVINVNLIYANDSLGVDIVNAVMYEYNAKRLDRLHENARNSIAYYDGRIAETLKTLEASSREVADYQKKNNLAGVGEEVGLLVENAFDMKKSIEQNNYNIAYFENVLDILRNRLNDDMLIPQMESLADPNIIEFNKLIEKRRELKRSATEENKTLHILNEQIDVLRKLIVENSEKMIEKAKSDVNQQYKTFGSTQGRLSKYPDFQLEFLNLMRDKEYQNALYQYLIGQRENAVLQIYSTQNAAFVFQPAYVKNKVSSLKKLIWPIAGLVMALFCSTCLAVLIMLLSRKVKAPMDVAFLNIDSKAVKYQGDEESMARMRMLLMATPSQRLIYVADFSDNTSAVSTLVQSFENLGLSVENVDVQGSNNLVLSREFSRDLSGMLESDDYIFVKIPQPDQLFEFEHVVEQYDAKVLVVVPTSMNRMKLKKYLKGQRASSIYTLIV